MNGLLVVTAVLAGVAMVLSLCSIRISRNSVRVVEVLQHTVELAARCGTGPSRDDGVARHAGMDRVVHEPLPVARVVEGDRRSWAPKFDQSWDDLTKLRWRAGVTAALTGLRVLVCEQPPYPVHRYGFEVGGLTAGCVYSFGEAWIYLLGVTAAARQQDLGRAAAAAAADSPAEPTTGRGASDREWSDRLEQFDRLAAALMLASSEVLDRAADPTGKWGVRQLSKASRVVHQPMVMTAIPGRAIEPNPDPAWDDLTQLRWEAALLAAQTGLRVLVYEEPLGYGFVIEGRPTPPSSYSDCLTLLRDVRRGVRAERERVKAAAAADAAGSGCSS